MAPYTEPADIGIPHREKLLEQVRSFITTEQARAAQERSATMLLDYTSPAAFAQSAVEHRQRFIQMLGYPLTDAPDPTPPNIRMEAVAQDELGGIHRVWVEALPGVEMYGLYFVPPGAGPFPFIISQHGGGGTPELCSGLIDSSNYNDMSRRFLRRGMAVFAPQLLMWKDDFGPHVERARLDAQLRALGGSLTGLELVMLRRSLDHFATRPEVDANRVAMAGLSYGGLYTHLFSAVDLRIQVALCSCYLYEQPHNFHDESNWRNAMRHFSFIELSALICPRPFYLEAGLTDDLVPADKFPPYVAQLHGMYARLGLADRFAYKLHDGWHEFDKADDGIDFVLAQLKPR